MADAIDTPFGGDGASLNTSEVTSSSVASPKTLNALSASPIDKRRKAPISSLPVELLVIIFREIYKSCRSRYEWNPWALASVCPSWEAAIHLTPEFWMHLTFYLDAWDFSAAFVASILVRSHNLIIQEVTFTRNIWTAEHDEHERARVMMAMQAITPHMHRCRAIMFNVRFSSSLPSFPNDFHGTAFRLESLELRCLEDDGGVIPTVDERNLRPLHHEKFECPNLRALTIDGRNYFTACQQNVNWTEVFPVVSTLVISQFTPVFDRSESFTSYTLMLSLIPFRHELTYFGIDNVHLDESPTPDLDDDDELDFKIDMILLKSMHNTSCMMQIIAFVGWPSDVHITRCRLDPEYVTGGGLWNISLKDIDTSEDLVEFLTGCGAEKLVIDNCPGFGDEVLHAMMTRNSGDSWWMIPYCAWNVQDLSICNCLDFSISTLRQVVETRRIPSYPHDFSGVKSDYPRPIRVLHLSGCVPDVSSEDIEWFQSRLSEFTYNPIQ